MFDEGGCELLNRSLLWASHEHRRAEMRLASDGSRQDLTDDVAVNVGEAVVAAAVAISRRFVVEPHHVQDGRVQVVDVDLVLDGVPAEFVGGPVDVAGLARRRRPSTW